MMAEMIAAGPDKEPTLEGVILSIIGGVDSRLRGNDGGNYTSFI